MAETGSVIVKIDTDELMDRIRPYLAQAWDQGWRDCAQVGPEDAVIGDNPYRESQ